MRTLEAEARTLQNIPGMTTRSDKLQILLVRSWLEPVAPFRDALRVAGIEAQITRVDFEAALNAALARGGFAAIVFDPNTRGLTRDMLDARVREHCRFFIPVIVLDGDEHVAAAVLARALGDLRN